MSSDGFKVGDKVQVVVKDLDRTIVGVDMRGEVTEVRRDEKITYVVKDDHGNHRRWPSDLVYPVPDEPKPKYKVGQKIRVKYETLDFTSDVLKTDKTCTVYMVTKPSGTDEWFHESWCHEIPAEPKPKYKFAIGDQVITTCGFSGEVTNRSVDCVGPVYCIGGYTRLFREETMQACSFTSHPRIEPALKALGEKTAVVVLDAEAYLRKIRDALIEVRRYVRTDVEHVRKRAGEILESLGEVYMLVRDDSTHEMIDRISSNLFVGLEYIQTHPQCLEGYIDGAVFELALKPESATR